MYGRAKSKISGPETNSPQDNWTSRADITGTEKMESDRDSPAMNVAGRNLQRTIPFAR